jgi:hypothetical protein
VDSPADVLAFLERLVSAAEDAQREIEDAARVAAG